MRLSNEIMRISVDHRKELNALKTANPEAYKIGFQDALIEAANLAALHEEIIKGLVKK